MSNPRTFTIISSPYYDRNCQQYQNILMVNTVPEGPLGAFIRKIQIPRLHREATSYSSIEGCGLAITNPFLSHPFNNVYNSFSNNNNNNCKNGLMTPNEIPDLYSFLTSNGYQIETQLTNMMNQSGVKITPGKQIVCMATYYDSKQPNIVYMK
jgi:hypothetical protein